MNLRTFVVALCAILLATSTCVAKVNSLSSGLRLKGIALNSEHPLQVEDGAGSDVFYVASDGDMTAVDGTFSGNVAITGDYTPTGDIIPATDGGADLGSATKAFGNVVADKFKTTTDTTLALEVGADGSGDTGHITMSTGNTVQWTIDENGDITGKSGNDVKLQGSGAINAESYDAVDGTAGIDIADSTGVVTFNASPDFGANVPTQVTSRTAWIGAESILVTGAGTDPALELKNEKVTYAFADATNDDLLTVSWSVPDDMDVSEDWEVQYLYLCDDATITEGEWNLTYVAVADDDADAAPGGELTVLDTAVAQNDWNLTGAMIVPAAAVTATDVVVYMSVYHDVSDPLCNGSAVNWAGLKITYTSNANY